MNESLPGSNAAESARLFVALPLPPSLKQAVYAWCSDLKQSLPFRKWTLPEDLHVTLQFLGATPESAVDGIKQALAKTASSAAPFALSPGAAGSFGPTVRPSVLWAGIDGDIARLKELQRRVSDALAPLGYEPEARPYKPHLTLARSYSGGQPLAHSQLALFGMPLTGDGSRLHWTARELALYISHLNRRPPQPMYEAVAVFPFCGK